MPPRLPRYEILAELGQGGMSVVYRARDTHLPREVAVKVLHEFMARDPDARLRFHREAVAVAKLHHPGIVEIFDYSGADAAEADGPKRSSKMQRRAQFCHSNGPRHLLEPPVCRQD